MRNKSLQKAIDSLSLYDISIRSSESYVVDGINPLLGDEPAFYQTKFFPKKYTVGTAKSSERDQDFVLYEIEAGIRWIKEEAQEEGKIKDVNSDFIFAEIQATFGAIYFINADLDKDCIDEFFEENAGHHVWPYWREYLQSQCLRMKLPPITLGMHQISEEKRLKKTASKKS